MNTNILSNHGKRITLGLMGLGLAASQCLTTFGMNARELRCEYNKNPEAVDETQPRLSWIVEAEPNQRGVRQRAFQVVVATSGDLLANAKGDLWDSGKVNSDQSVNVVYAGQDLTAGQWCYWKVRVWDQAGIASPWSAPARWGVGLLKPSDWQAKWIGYEAPPAQENAASAAMAKLLRLDDQHWVWANGAKSGNQPVGKVYFRKVIQIPADRPVQQAIFLLAADDGFQLFINGHPSGQGNSWRTLSSPEITGRLQPGANAIGIEVANAGETPSPAGLVGRLVIAFASGEPMVVPIDTSWQTSPRRPSAGMGRISMPRVGSPPARWPSSGSSPGARSA